MSDKEMVSVRLHTDTKRRVERYAEEHDVSRSTAIRRLLEKGADLEEAGLAIAASKQTGGEESDEEKEVVADGSGTIRGGLTTSFGVVLAVAVLSWVGSFTSLVPATAALAITYSAITIDLILGGILYTSLPEKLDRIFYSGVNRIGQMARFMGGTI